MKEADLNISVQSRNDFMQSIFGEVPAIEESAEKSSGPVSQQNEPTYPGITNQDMVNIIDTAGRQFTDDTWIHFFEKANMVHLAIPSTNRDKPYTGPKIEEIPTLTTQEKVAILGLVKASINGDNMPMPTYQGITNQDMIKLIFQAAKPFTGNPWKDWIQRARLDSIGVPTANRRKAYTGPKAESLPNLTQEEKLALLSLIKQ